jgi:hypothetical protein
MIKAVYDKNAKTKNLVTTISGVVTLIITLLSGFGVITAEQATATTEQASVLLTLVPQVVAAVASLILIFKAQDA